MVVFIWCSLNFFSEIINTYVFNRAYFTIYNLEIAFVFYTIFAVFFLLYRTFFPRLRGVTNYVRKRRKNNL